jgi:DNA-binding MarR family transcriptional regulator
MDRAAQETTGDLLFATARLLRRRFMAALAEYDVTPAQARALRVICVADSAPRLADVAEGLRVAPRTATELVDALEAAGLVERAADPDDRRATRVQTTGAGRRLSEVIGRTRREEAGRFLADLPEGDRRELHRILQRLAGTEAG